MKLLIAGGTGFIGAPLCRALAQAGHELLIVTRTPSPGPGRNGTRFLSWEGAEWRRAMAEVDGVINLAGEPLAGKRWSPKQKALIRESRIETTSRLIDAIAVPARRPTVLVNASAIGYYGAHGDEELDEHEPAGRGFLADTCQAWEVEARHAETLGVRVVRLRIGVVLGPGGGAVAKMTPPFRCWIGGPLGNGRQWMSWVHLEDVLRLIEWALTHPALSGAVNVTSPQPATMRAFCETLGEVLKRPSWAPVPPLVLRLLLGEMAEVLLTGQRVIPAAALRSGFAFRFPQLRSALEACLRRAA
ncbi:MAG: TIGR01777 family protein [Candidatus Omnitrophica bacterium]|nr:TIGR01777 family protein [Candidatus Omnitrophota bacterium]MBI3083299.1 TIGR01777 family protein [Candidatus Omnitrophota bacterium]